MRDKWSSWTKQSLVDLHWGEKNLKMGFAGDRSEDGKQTEMVTSSDHEAICRSDKAEEVESFPPPRQPSDGRLSTRNANKSGIVGWRNGKERRVFMKVMRWLRLSRESHQRSEKCKEKDVEWLSLDVMKDLSKQSTIMTRLASRVRRGCVFTVHASSSR